MESGEYNKAIPLYKKAYTKIRRKDKKKKPEIAFKIGDCYRRMNFNKDAETWFKRAIMGKYQVPLVYLYYGDMLRYNNNASDAMIQYQEYKKLMPDDPRANNALKSLTLFAEQQKKQSKYIIENLKAVNTRDGDFGVSYAKEDYTQIYFTSSRTAAKGDKISGVTGVEFTDLFQSRRDRKGVWSEPTPVDTINSDYDDGSACFNSNHTTVIFTRCPKVKGAKYGCQLFTAQLQQESWSKPIQITLFQDSTVSVGHPTLSPDELKLYFAADKRDGHGKDIWVAKRNSKSDAWDAPVKLPKPINTQGDEMFPFCRFDTTLYFSSNNMEGLGGLDIYKASLKEDMSWEVTNLGYPMNSPQDDFGIIFESEREAGMFCSSRTGGVGGDDIYMFNVPPVLYTLVGIVKDIETGKPIQGATIKLEGSNGIINDEMSGNNGEFKFNLKGSTDYLITSTKTNFLKGKTKETTKGLEKNTELKVELLMRYVPPALTDNNGNNGSNTFGNNTNGNNTNGGGNGADTSFTIELENVYYDLNQWIPRKESYVSLDVLVEILKDNPSVTIELRSHTDFRGSDIDNDTLSQKRAQSVVDYLIVKGIDSERLYPRGYGETRPRMVDSETAKKYPFLKIGARLDATYINSMPDTEKKEICHLLNRRTEFMILRWDYESKRKQ